MSDRLDELHAKKLRAHEKLEVCEMLAARGDVRLAAVVTDTLLLGSAAALAKHRERQLDIARSLRGSTDGGKQRRADLLTFLADEALWMASTRWRRCCRSAARPLCSRRSASSAAMSTART